MKIEIKELHKIEKHEYEKLYEMLIEAFAEYPKLRIAFPDEKTRLTAIEMTLRFYGAYDLTHGVGYSLDADLNEAVLMLHSDYVGFPDELVEAADCYGGGFQKAASHLTEEEVIRWDGFFEEVDEKEAELQLPKPYLYLDFVAVRAGCQGSGRGSQIIRTICRYAEEQGLPVMLFTNGERDIAFYQKNGFRIIAVTRSETYGFENTYMWYDVPRRDL
ncbi:MAG: GNAT family N-acetyltransferase [Firmicutes bacterium]|nr:GNAT family N-acetyltransferase [Bacillota bacterium]